MSDNELTGSEKIHYGCSRCLKVFNTEEDCDNHVASCVNTYEGTAGNSSNKRKLSDSSNGTEEPPKEAANVQHATSHMLSENEMLITLPSQTTIKPVVEKAADPTFLFYDPPSVEETIIVEETTTIGDNIGKNVKVLSLLSGRDIEKQCRDVVTVSSAESDEILIYREEGINNSDIEIIKIVNEDYPTKQSLTSKKQCQNKALEIEDTNKKVLVNLKTKMYKKIMKDTKEEEEKEPNEFSVYDFRDEEEENLNQSVKETKKKEQELKERTCMDCKKVFDDPMDVLCHRREFHKRFKVYVSAEELEEYKNVPDRTKCPICSKKLNKHGYMSFFLTHLKTHSNSYDFECKICGLRFRRKDHWQNHESRHVVSLSEVNVDDNKKGKASS